MECPNTKRQKGWRIKKVSFPSKAHKRKALGAKGAFGNKNKKKQNKT